MGSKQRRSQTLSNKEALEKDDAINYQIKSSLLRARFLSLKTLCNSIYLLNCGDSALSRIVGGVTASKTHTRQAGNEVCFEKHQEMARLKVNGHRGTLNVLREASNGTEALYA